jgi:hypothetical protein
MNLSALLRSSLVSGSIASAVSAAVLSSLAKAEGKSPVQPINATSHWLHGEEAGKVKQLDARHTGAGYATHHAACVLWSSLFETIRSRAADTGPASILRDAALVSTIAAVVDYGLVPRRLTPGPAADPLGRRRVRGSCARPRTGRSHHQTPRIAGSRSRPLRRARRRAGRDSVVVPAYRNLSKAADVIASCRSPMKITGHSRTWPGRRPACLERL